MKLKAYSWVTSVAPTHTLEQDSCHGLLVYGETVKDVGKVTSSGAHNSNLFCIFNKANFLSMMLTGEVRGCERLQLCLLNTYIVQLDIFYKSEVQVEEDIEEHAYY